MKLKALLGILILATTCLAATDQASKPTSAGVDKPQPTVSDGNKVKILNDIVTQQGYRIQMGELEKQYKDLATKAQNSQQAMKDDMTRSIKDAGLDPEKFQVSIEGPDNKISISPKADTAPATPSTEKK